MKYIRKHRISGKEVYKFNNNYYYLEGENFIKIVELTDKQKMIMKIMHEHGTEINNNQFRTNN